MHPTSREFFLDSIYKEIKVNFKKYLLYFFQKIKRKKQ